MWTLEDPAIRHARYYAELLDQLQQQYGGGDQAQLAALAAFDRDQAQIDHAWSWLLTHAPGADTDDLLIAYGAASIDLGDLRYEKLRQRLQHFTAMLDAARRRNQQREQAVALANIASTYHDVSQFACAIEYYTQARTIAHALGDHDLDVAIMTNQGRACYARGEYQHALQWYEEARALGQDLAGDDYVLLGNLALVHAMLGHTVIAENLYTEALVLVKSAGDLRAESSVLGDMGLLHYDQGRYDSAYTLHQQALSLSRALRDHYAEGDDLINLGLALQALGQIDAAAASFQDAYCVAASIGNRQGMAYALGNQGRLLFEQGDLPGASNAYTATLLLAEEIGDQKCLALALLGAAKICLGQHAGQETIRLCQRSLTIMRGIGTLPEMGQVLSLLARAYVDLEQSQDAYSVYAQWYAYACTAEGSERERCEALVGMGGVAHAQGRYRRAYRHYHHAWLAARQLCDQGLLGMIVWNMGLLLVAMGRPRHALHCLYAAVVAGQAADDPLVHERRAYLEDYQKRGQRRRVWRKWSRS